MNVMHMVETTRTQYEKHTVAHTNLSAWTRTWEGPNYSHVYTYCYTTRRHDELLVALHVVNHDNPEHDQYFVWDEVELGIHSRRIN